MRSQNCKWLGPWLSIPRCWVRKDWGLIASMRGPILLGRCFQVHSTFPMKSSLKVSPNEIQVDIATNVFARFSLLPVCRLSKCSTLDGPAPSISQGQKATQVQPTGLGNSKKEYPPRDLRPFVFCSHFAAVDPIPFGDNHSTLRDQSRRAVHLSPINPN